MIRHPDAPVDTPKFLGHGHVNQENRTSILSGPNGAATDDGSTVGEVAWRLMSSVKAPPHELRGIGIQLTKLEKEGFSVELVPEKGQSKLSFRPREIDGAGARADAKSSREGSSNDVGRRSTSGDPVRPRAAAEGAPNSKLPLTLVLTSDSSEGEAKVRPAPEDVSKAPQSRLRPRSVRSSTRPVESYIPSMFRPTKKPARCSTKSASQVTADELRYYDIDPEAYSTFDRALQDEVLVEARRRKPPPSKPKACGTKPAATEQPTTRAPEVIVLPPSPAEATDSQILAMQYDPVMFRELGKATQLEQIALHQARQARTVPGDRSSRRVGQNDAACSKGATRYRPPTRAIAVRPAPRFQGQADLPEILDRIESWMEAASEHAPAREDVEALGRYIEKCASRELGHDLAQATQVLRWWDFLLSREFPVDKPVDLRVQGVAELWRLGYLQVCERLERVVQQATGRVLKL